MQLFVASVLLLASGACANSAKFGDLYRDAVFVAPLRGAPMGRWVSADEAAWGGDSSWNGLQFSGRHAPLRSKLVSPAGFRFATRAGFAPEALAADAVVADDAIAENNVVFVKSPFALTGAEAAWRKAGAIPITAEGFANPAVADEYAITVPEASKYDTIIPADAAVLRTPVPSHILAGAPTAALRHPSLIARAFPSLAAPSFKRTQFGAAEPSVFLKSLKGAELIPTAAGKLAADAPFLTSAKLFAKAPFGAEEALATDAVIPAPARFVKAFEGEEEAALAGAVRFAPRFQHVAAAPEAFKYKLVAMPAGVRNFITPARAAEAQESAAIFADETAFPSAFPAGVMPLKHAIATPAFY